MRVPDFLVRQFYVKGSLQPEGDGFRLQARNGMGDGTLVGIVDGAEFPASTCTMSAGDRLFLYSDGVFEIPIKDGPMWEYEEFVEWMAQAPPEGVSKMDNLHAHTRELQGSDLFGDDFSVVEFGF